MSDHGDPSEAGSRDARLSREFVRLADTLVDDFDVVELLDNLVHACVDLLGVTAAGLLLLDHQQNLQPIASSDETSRLIELFQLQNDEGPCLDCVRSGEPIHTTGVSRMNDRWPRFGPAAQRSGFSAVSALPLRLRHDIIGSLNLFYADGLAPVLPADTQIAQSLADVATIGILQQRSLHRASLLAEQLQAALNTRIVIEQAKGVLAEHGGVDMGAAFEALRSHARHHGLKLTDVAESLVRGGTRPADVLAPRAQRP
jgi:transcriptional regulator with GAF, ATPase, and Fis domain